MTSETTKTNVTVVGCGVSGLTSGIRLLENGFSVTIVAREIPPDTTSDIPAAVWYPYLPDTDDKEYKKRVAEWARVTYEEGYKLAKDESSGVSLVKFTEFFEEDAEDPWWKDTVKDFQRETGNCPPGYEDGYSMETPLFETPKYMPYLVKRFENSGGRIENREVTEISDLYGENRLIVNCAGLGAGKLVGDEGVYPIRGQIIRAKATGIDRCLIDETLTPDTRIFGYIVPRSEDCILGGTSEEYDYNVETESETAKEIENRCRRLAPNLEIEILEHKVGLRPGRNTVCLKRDKNIPEYKQCAVIHNYGHSGSGFTLSWGCADEVVRLAEDFRAA